MYAGKLERSFSTTPTAGSAHS